MKKLILIIVVLATTFCCNNDDDATVSVLNGFIGEWNLQSRVMNNDSPLIIEDDKLRFTEDSDISDFSGNFEIIAASSSNGSFEVGIYNTLIFTSVTGSSITYDFELNNVTLELSYTDANGNNISEVWVKNY